MGVEEAGALGGALAAAGPVGGFVGDFVEFTVAVAGVLAVPPDGLVDVFVFVATTGCDDPEVAFAAAEALLAADRAAAPGVPRLPPLPLAFPPRPRSRCKILAAALAFPRSRFLSARAALAVLFGVTVGGVVTADWLGEAVPLTVLAACLFSTFTASRAACSTLTACALRFLGEGGVVVLLVDLFSSVAVALVSFESCRACLLALAGVAFSLPLFAFLSFRNCTRGVTVTFSLLFAPASFSWSTEVDLGIGFVRLSKKSLNS